MATYSGLLELFEWALHAREGARRGVKEAKAALAFAERPFFRKKTDREKALEGPLDRAIDLSPEQNTREAFRLHLLGVMLEAREKAARALRELGGRSASKQELRHLEDLQAKHRQAADAFFWAGGYDR